jgi:hypothetical protein
MLIEYTSSAANQFWGINGHYCTLPDMTYEKFCKTFDAGAKSILEENKHNKETVSGRLA